MAFPVQTLPQLRPILVGFRKAAGLTQAQLAARLGVTQQSYAQLEANPSAVSMERLFKVLNVLGVRVTLEPGDAAAPAPSASAPEQTSPPSRRSSSGSSNRSAQPAPAPAAAKATRAATRKQPAAAAPRKARDAGREDW